MKIFKIAVFFALTLLGVVLAAAVDSSELDLLDEDELIEEGELTDNVELSDDASGTENYDTSTQNPETFVSTHFQNRLSSDFMLSLYRNLSQGVPLYKATGRTNHWKNLKYADTVRTFTPVGGYESSQLHVYKFNFSQMAETEVIRGAELIFRLPPDWNGHQLYTVSVASAADGPGLTYASSIPIVTPTLTNLGLAAVDTTIPVKDWLLGFAAPDENRRINEQTLDIAVVAINRRKGFTRSKLLSNLEKIYDDNVIDNTWTPEVIMVTYSEAGKDFLNTTEVYSHLNRTRRSTKVEMPANEGASICHRNDLNVDFLALGWGEWVVYPTSFNAYQCSGKCGGFTDSRHNPTNHAIVQGLVKLVTSSEIPISCCSPTKLSPLSILYLENGIVIIKYHEDMIVEECGCL